MYKKIYNNSGYSIVDKVGKHIELFIYDEDNNLITKSEFMPNKVTGIKDFKDYERMLLELGYRKEWKYGL